MKKNTERLITNRLILRRFEKTDAVMMFNNWATDINTVKHLEWDMHANIDETNEYIEYVLEKYKKDYTFNWCIEERETGEVIGSISAFNIDLKNNICEVGYAIGSKWHGKGYGTETLTRVLQYLHEEVGFYKIICNCSSENLASKRIMEKSNMQLDGVLKRRLKSRFDELNDRADIYTFSYPKDNHYIENNSI